MGVDGLRADKVFPLLVGKGYRRRRIAGSHHIFSCPGRGSIPVPVHDHKIRMDVFQAILKQLWKAEQKAEFLSELSLSEEKTSSLTEVSTPKESDKSNNKSA